MSEKTVSNCGGYKVPKLKVQDKKTGTVKKSKKTKKNKG